MSTCSNSLCVNSGQVPVEYNSNILHVLEAYYGQSQELKRKDLEVNELKIQLNQQMDQVEVLGKEWSDKEAQYKTELKRLEVMVANGVAGLVSIVISHQHLVLLEWKPVIVTGVIYQAY